VTIRLLEYFSKQHDWCREILEDAYVDEELLKMAREASLV